MNANYSIYIHIPYCLSKCAYCDFYSRPVCNGHNAQIVPQDYVDALCNEISTELSEYKNRLCKSIYIGGGTPSLLSKHQLEQIIHTLKTCSNFKKNLEFTLEANPDDITEDFLKFIYSLGVNRISCGIQSMNDQVLSFINRRAKRTENLKALDLLKKYWKGTLSLDLISALPYETAETFTEGLKLVIDANPDHISLYSLTIEEETPLGQMVNNGTVEYDFDGADEMWLLGRDLLESNGYNQYEISNFAKKGFECIHNKTYWHHQDYLGFGSGATGTEYKSGFGYRKTNTTETEKYIDFWKNGIQEKITIEEEVEPKVSCFEFFMMGLRTLEGITASEYEYYFGKEIPSSVKELFLEWKENNLAVVEPLNTGSEVTTRYALNKDGILFLNSFLEKLDV